MPHTEPCNVLHLVNNLRIGGLENVIKQLALARVDGVCQSVCVLDKIGPCAEELRDEGIPLYHLDRGAAHSGSFKIVRSLLRIIRAQEIGILHPHDISSWFWGTFAARVTRTKMVFTKHGQLHNPSLSAIILIKVLSILTDKIVAVSTQVEMDMVTRQFVDRNKICVILNGVALDRFSNRLPRAEAKKRLGIGENSFVAGTVTRFYSVKNIEMQLEMVAHLRSLIPDFQYLIVAPMTNEYGKRIADEVTQRRLENNIHLLGFRHDIPDLLRAMDVFVLTSFSEGTSLALLEALASGCAVVATKVGGNVSLVSHGINGLLFDVNDLPALLSHMQFLYQHPEIRDSMGNAGKTWAQKFSLSSMIENYVKLYRQIGIQ